MENVSRGRPPKSLPRMTSFQQFIEDTERTLVPDDKRDPEVTKALKALKYLNRYDTLSPNKLPYIPKLPYNYEEELAHLNMTSNDILEDWDVPGDIVEIPVSKFLEHVPDVKPAKSIMKKIEASDKKYKSRTKRSKEASKVQFHCEQQECIKFN